MSSALSGILVRYALPGGSVNADGDMAEKDLDEIIKALRCLTQNRGIWRSDLIDVLRGPASLLCIAWSIDLDNELGATRTTVARFLQGYFAQTKKPKAKSVDDQGVRDRIFEWIYDSSFNLSAKGSRETLLILEERRTALISKYKIKRATIDRDYRHALTEVARLVKSGYQPQMPAAPALAVDPPLSPESTEPPQDKPPIDPSSPPEVPVPPWYRRRPVQLAALAGVVVAAAGVVVPLSLSGDNSTSGATPPSTPTPGAVAELPAVVTTSTTPTPTGPPPPPLNVTVESIRDAQAGWHATFDRTDPAGMAALNAADHQPFPSDHFPEFLRQQLDAGAYLAGGAMLKLQVNGVATGAVDITNVRVVIEKREPVKDGVTLVLGTQGNQLDENMGFHLDDANPESKDYDPVNMTFGSAYFRDKHPRIEANTADTLNIMTLAARQSYSFRIALDYTVGSKRGTQVISLDGTAHGTPFRVTPDYCATKAYDIPAADRDRLRLVRYSAIRTMGVDSSVNGYGWETPDPAVYGPGCDR